MHWTSVTWAPLSREVSWCDFRRETVGSSPLQQQHVRLTRRRPVGQQATTYLRSQRICIGNAARPFVQWWAGPPTGSTKAPFPDGATRLTIFPTLCLSASTRRAASSHRTCMHKRQHTTLAYGFAQRAPGGNRALQVTTQDERVMMVRPGCRAQAPRGEMGM